MVKHKYFFVTKIGPQAKLKRSIPIMESCLVCNRTNTVSFLPGGDLVQ